MPLKPTPYSGLGRHVLLHVLNHKIFAGIAMEVHAKRRKREATGAPGDALNWCHGRPWTRAGFLWRTPARGWSDLHSCGQGQSADRTPAGRYCLSRQAQHVLLSADDLNPIERDLVAGVVFCESDAVKRLASRGVQLLAGKDVEAAFWFRPVHCAIIRDR